MTRLSGAVLIGVLAYALTGSACGGSAPTEDEAEMVEAAPRAPDAAAVAAADRLSSKLGSDLKLVPTVRDWPRSATSVREPGGSKTSSSRRFG